MATQARFGFKDRMRLRTLPFRYGKSQISAWRGRSIDGSRFYLLSKLLEGTLRWVGLFISVKTSCIGNWQFLFMQSRA
jgi:hypothetical protein